MISTIALLLPHSRRAVMVVLGLGTVAACSIFAVAGQSAAKIERPAQEQVTRQTQFITGREQPQIAATEITQPRQQPGFAQDEIARLAQDRTQVQSRPPAARSAITSASSMGRQPQNRASNAGSVARAPAHPPQAPARPARTAPKKPGPRLLVAEAGK
jgi:hypothetical protein